MAEDAKEFVSKNSQNVLQNVEKVLEDAPQNEETLGNWNKCCFT
ncbi:hypothetical protein [Rickettsia sibirica]|uniref:Uncharacterized protein n=1 Tax=Rickettsia sibirica (strain ATCC VR-151 / 246) TaxID=272951 RepID=Q7P8N0_RICS2|nr:hypothetical protein [Rickettsia sibirica]EAA26513.1 hypothetical protein rsib_orf1375 [Rickettsia sibirica 246]